MDDDEREELEKLSKNEWQEIASAPRALRAVAIALVKDVLTAQQASAPDDHKYTRGLRRAAEEAKLLSPLPLGQSKTTKAEAMKAKITHQRAKIELDRVLASSGVMREGDNPWLPAFSSLVRGLRLRTNNREEVYDCLLSMVAAINDRDIPSTLRNDLSDCLAAAATKFNAGPSEAYSRSAINGSSYEKARNKEITLYPEQRLVINRVCEAVLADESLIVRYATPPSAGKTSIVAPLGAKMTPRVLLYTCYSGVVRTEVCKYCHAVQIPFAVVTGRTVRPSYVCNEGRRKWYDQSTPLVSQLAELKNCKRPPTVIVADLRGSLQAVNFVDVLMLDEPTCGDSSLYKELISTAPKVLILVSATLPQGRLTSAVENIFNAQGRKASVFEVENSKQRAIFPSVHFGCADEPPFYPYEAWALKECDFGAMGKDKFLMRFLGPSVLASLLTDCDDDVSHSLVNVHRDEAPPECIRLLIKHSGRRERWRTSAIRKLEGSITNFSDMITVKATAFPGTTLVVCPTPGVLRASVADILQIPDYQVVRARDKAVGEDKECAFAKKKILSDPELRTDESERGLAIEKLGVATLKWPSVQVINSREHSLKYDKEPISNFKTHPKLTPDDVEGHDLQVIGNMLSGVGEVESDRLARQATDNGFISSAMASLAISYGYDSVDENVVLLPGQKLNRDCLLQLCARVGRVGRSKSARIVLQEKEKLDLLFGVTDNGTGDGDMLINALLATIPDE